MLVYLIADLFLFCYEKEFMLSLKKIDPKELQLNKTTYTSDTKQISRFKYPYPIIFPLLIFTTNRTTFILIL